MLKPLAAAGILLGVLFFGGRLSGLQTFRIVFYLVGLGVPACILFEPLFVWVQGRIKVRLLKQEQDRFVENISAKMMNSIQDSNSSQFQEQAPQNILEPPEITKLNALRKRTSITEASMFPRIRVTGKNMPNLVPEAGCFTAKINREGEITNIVVLLATLHAVSEFKRFCSAYDGGEKDFWAEGYLLPSRTGFRFSVLLATAFRLNGRYIQF